MKINRLAIEAVLVGVLLLASILLGLDRATGQASVRADKSAPDTTAVARLTHVYDQAGPTIIQATADVTGTNAAILTASLLLDQPYYLVSLPSISR